MKTHENKELRNLIHWVESQQRFKPKTDLNRMKKAFKMNHISLDDTYMIHVAGTNGKGSTCEYLSQIFLTKGLHVGKFTSPYILSFNERITIDGKPIDDDKLTHYLQAVQSFNEQFGMQYGETLSFFELLTLAAFIAFEKAHVDVVIMEVGIGGLLDATNAYDHYDLSLITNIGFDHMQQLGNTLESIAYNKLGIIKENGTLISTVDKSLHDYFKAYAKTKEASITLIEPVVKVIEENPLTFVYKDQTYVSGLTGRYQINNAVLAIEAAKRTPFHVDEKSIQKGLKEAYVPARLTFIKPLVIVDGAHNVHAMEALKETMQSLYPNLLIHTVFSALGDKNIPEMLSVLQTFSNSIDLVTFPDARFESLVKYKSDKINYYKDDVIDYLNELMNKQKDEVILITGSLHFAGYILSRFK